MYKGADGNDIVTTVTITTEEYEHLLTDSIHLNMALDHIEKCDDESILKSGKSDILVADNTMRTLLGYSENSYHVEAMQKKYRDSLKSTEDKVNG